MWCLAHDSPFAYLAVFTTVANFLYNSLVIGQTRIQIYSNPTLYEEEEINIIVT